MTTMPEGVLERFEETMQSTALGRMGSSLMHRESLEAALDQLREELEGDEAVDIAASRFEELLKAERFAFEFPESFMRAAVEAALNSVLGDREAK